MMIGLALPVLLVASSTFLGNCQGTSVSFRGSDHIPFGEEGIDLVSDVGQGGRRLENLDHCGLECPSGDLFCSGTCSACITNQQDGFPYCSDPTGIDHDKPEKPEEDIAKGKVATQSSTCFGAPASRAADGNTDPDFNHGSVSHTCEGGEQWWMVDLGAYHTIKVVEVFNRLKEQERLSNFDLEVLDRTHHVVATIHQGYGIGDSKEFSFKTGGARGRYVRIRLPNNRGPLSLAEVVVKGYYDPNQDDLKDFELKNVALRKPAFQSCTLFEGGPSRAVDGNHDGNFQAGSVTHTCFGPDRKEWWMVDLKGCHLIQSVKLYNRDILQERLANFDLELLDKNKKVLTSIHQRGVVKSEKTFSSQEGLEGCFVKIRKNDSGVLSLAEVEVMAFDDPSWKPSPSEDLYNIAKHKRATQSCTLYGAGAGRAIDGNHNGDFEKNSVTHTCADGQSRDEWWMVDLDGPYFLESVKIYNRDSYQDRLSHFYVEVLDENRVEVLSTHQVNPIGDSKVFHLAGGRVKGYFVRIRKEGNDEPLSLAEVEVMGYWA